MEMELLTQTQHHAAEKSAVHAIKSLRCSLDELEVALALAEAEGCDNGAAPSTSVLTPISSTTPVTLPAPVTVTLLCRESESKAPCSTLANWSFNEW